MRLHYVKIALAFAAVSVAIYAGLTVYLIHQLSWGANAMSEIKKPENPEAFPHHWSQDAPGMTLRDFFAAPVINGLYGGRQGDLTLRVEDMLEDAKVAYSIADAMLEARQ
jgi:hypothetical protein